MENERFDQLTRSVALSRRGAVRAVAAGIFGIVAGAAGRSGVAAKPKKKDDPFYRAMKRCGRPEECGAKAPCDPDYHVCMPTECLIDGTPYRLGAPNPENFCQVCNATTWDHWLDRSRNETCPDSTGNPCVVDFGTCVAGECVLENVPDGTSCGEAQICCAGVCCGAGLSCIGGACRPIAEDPDGGSDTGDDEDEPGEPDDDPDEGEDEEDDDPPPGDPDPGEGCEGPDCAPSCHIGTDEWADGDRNPLAECEVCDPSRNANAWSFADDNSTCGGASDRYCCQGICCVPGKCCSPVGLCVSNIDFACPALIPQGG